MKACSLLLYYDCIIAQLGYVQRNVVLVVSQDKYNRPFLKYLLEIKCLRGTFKNYNTRSGFLK